MDLNGESVKNHFVSVSLFSLDKESFGATGEITCDLWREQNDVKTLLKNSFFLLIVNNFSWLKYPILVVYGAMCIKLHYIVYMCFDKK